MKKLIFLIPLLVSLFAPAQQRQPRQPSTSNTLVDQHVHVELAFRTPVFADTTAANAVTSLDSCGKLIYTYDADAHWSRACFPVRHWVRVGSTTSLTGSQSIFIAGDGSPGAPYTPTLIISQQSGNAVTVNPDGVFVQAQIPNGLIEGGFVIHLTGLTYLVTPARYAINGVIYTSPATEITLQNADLNDPRFDAFVVTTSSTAEDITGTPDPTNPQNPSFDPLTQLPLTFVQVTANQTEPTVCRDSIYYPNNGNTWTALASAPTRINITSTTDPYSVTQAIDFTAAQNNDFLRMEKGSTISISTYAVMALRLKSKAQWASTSRISIQFYSNATPLGVPVIIGDFTPYGFNSSNTATYQTPVIPLANFGSGLGTANAVVLTVLNTGANTIGFRLDDWELLGCDGAPPTTGSFWNTTGNQEGRPLIGGTLDNQIVQFKANNLNHTQLKTDGTTWMQGTNPGVSFFLGTFAASDYFIRRVANTNTLNVAAAGIIDHTVQGLSMYNISAANGHLYNSSAGTFQMQLNASGQLLVGTNSQTASNLVAFNSTTRAVRFTNTTAAQMNAISNDAGMITYNTTAGELYYNNGSAWLPIGAGTSITANNGLTINPAANVQLGSSSAPGSALIHNSYINSGTFFLNITGTSNGVFRVQNTDASNSSAITASAVDGAGVAATSVSNSAVSGSSTSGKGGAFQSSTNNGMEAVTSSSSSASGSFVVLPTSTNTVRSVIDVSRLTTGTAADGIGGKILFNVSTTVGGKMSNEIISKWTTAADATRTSQFIITGVNSTVTADILTLNGSGQGRLNKYGVGSFTSGTPAYGLAVTADGTIIESPVGGGISGITADNGVTASSSTNVKWGGDLTQATTTVTGVGSEKIVFVGSPTVGTFFKVDNSAGTNTFAIEAISNGSVGVFGQGNNGGIGITGYSSTGTGVQAYSDTGLPLDVTAVDAATTTVTDVIVLTHETSGTPAAGFGSSIDYRTETTSGVGQLSNQLITKWTDATNATRTSAFSITGVNSAVTGTILTLAGNGAMTLGAAYQGFGAGFLAVDNAGVVTWSVGSGGGGGDMVKVGTAVNDQLGVWTGNGTMEGDVDLTFTGSSLTIGLAGTSTGELILAGSTSGTVTIKSQAAAGGITLTLPANVVNGQYLKTDGSGNLSWDSPAGAGTVTTFTFTDGSGFDGTVTNPTSTPTLALAITASGMLKGSAGAIMAAVSGTDYLPITGGTSVTTLGTIGTGTWQGTAVGATFGGTGQTSWTAGQMLVATGVNTLGKLSPGTNGQVLQIVAGVPAWATAGTVSTVDGGTTGLTFTNPTTTPTMTGTLGFANGGTSATSRQAAINALAGAVTNGQVLRGNGTNIVMGQVNAATDITGTLQLANGGLGTNTITSGQIFIGAAGNTIIKGTILGTANQINSSFNGTNYVISHAFNPTEQVLTSGAVITWNLLNGGNALLTLTNTGATLASPSNVVAGYTYTLRIIQGSGGGRTITTWTNVHWTGGTPPVLQTAVGKMDVIRLYAVTSTYFVGTIIPDVQ